MCAGRRFRCIIDSRWFESMRIDGSEYYTRCLYHRWYRGSETRYLWRCDVNCTVPLVCFFRIVVGVTSPDAECGISSLQSLITTQCRQAVSNVIYRYFACHLPVIYLQSAFVSVMSSTGTLSVIYDSHCYLDNDTNLKSMDRHAGSKRCYLISS